MSAQKRSTQLIAEFATYKSYIVLQDENQRGTVDEHYETATALYSIRSCFGTFHLRGWKRKRPGHLR